MHAVRKPHAAAVVAAAVLRAPPGKPPLLGHVTDHRHQRAQLAGIEDLLGLETGAVEVMNVSHHELDAASVCSGHHGVALLQTERHRLLYQHVLARVEAVDGEPMMQLVDQHDVLKNRYAY